MRHPFPACAALAPAPLLLASFCFAQDSPTFEVAFVKRLLPESGAPGSNVMRGGPGTDDPGRIAFPGVTMEQLKLMLQSLIAERFHVKLHHEIKSSAGYELAVAKRGAKLPASADAPDSQPPCRNPASVPAPGLIRLTFSKCGVSNLVAMLGMLLGEPSGNRVASARVVDKIELRGKYDFAFEFAGYMMPGGALPASTPDAPGANGPSIFAALETQLGLRLEEKNVQCDVLVIDSIDKTPVED